MDSIITCEQEAWSLLEELLNGNYPDEELPNIRFSGWPELTVKYEGERFKGNIPYSVLKKIDLYQQEIYRSYALLRYNHPSIKRLKKSEKRALELSFSLEPGCTKLGIDTEKISQGIGQGLLQGLSKMESRDLKAVIIAVSLIAGAGWAVHTYVNHLSSETKLQNDLELKKSEHQNRLEMEVEKTRQMELIAQVSSRYPAIDPILKGTGKAQLSLAEPIDGNETATIRGVTLNHKEVKELLKQDAKPSLNSTDFTGDYKVTGLVLKPSGLEVTVMLKDPNNNEYRAIVSRDMISDDAYQLLRSLVGESQRLTIKLRRTFKGEQLLGTRILEVVGPTANVY